MENVAAALAKGTIIMSEYAKWEAHQSAPEASKPNAALLAAEATWPIP